LTFVLDLEWVKVNQHAKYLGQKSFRSTVIEEEEKEVEVVSSPTDSVIRGVPTAELGKYPRKFQKFILESVHSENLCSP